MHYHLEIVMPPTADVEAAIEQIMRPFDENNEESYRPFWDWFQIGGRYSGSKLEACVPKQRMDAFHEELKARKVTVSGLQWGKQELQPASQIPPVDKLWREMCPGAGDVCPMFQHSGKFMSMDKCTVAQLPDGLTAHHLIIAALDYEEKEMQATHMLIKEIYNGVTHQKTDFDGNVLKAINGLDFSHYKAEYAAKITPKPDWLVVTVDYHS